MHRFFVYGREKSGVGFGIDVLSIVITVLVCFALIMGAIGVWLRLWLIVRWLINDF